MNETTGSGATEDGCESGGMVGSVSGCQQVEPLDDFDDLYQAGLSDDQLCGRMSIRTERFDINADCSALERHLIAEMKAYLRPMKAPDSLVRRCRKCLEQVTEQDAHSAATGTDSGDNGSENTDDAGRGSMAHAAPITSTTGDTHDGEIPIV